MPHRSDESLFAAFQTQRDCQALGVVFHRHAEELLRLAVFLAPRPTDAEDLVQATFLSAIARAETFVAGNRVMSWLCGILTNHARMLRRSERRSLPDARDDVAEDPADAVLRTELRSALATGIAGLPEPYRSVLSLHLEQGLECHEISRQLARPPATVRKQMERALDRLRTALPMGLAAAFASRLDAASLAHNAADAARFVEPAGEAQTVTTTAAPAGWQFVGVGMLSLGVVLAALVWWCADATSVANVVRPVAEAMVESGGRESVAPTSSDDPNHELRHEVADRCALLVHAAQADGTPVQAIDLVLVSDNGRSLPERLMTGLGTTVRTDERGQARFVGLPAGTYDLTYAGALSKQRVHLEEAQQECQVLMPYTTRIDGIVVGPTGLPVADAEVLATESSQRGDLGAVVARSRADGSFTAEVRLTTGRVFAQHVDFGSTIGLRLEADRQLRLVLAHSRRRVEVQVEDADGAPVVGAYVALVPRSVALTLFPPQHLLSDAAGRCSFADPGPREATVLASRLGLAPTTVDLAANAVSLVVRLQRGCRLRGRVLDGNGIAQPGQEVIAAVPDGRSNEPVSPLISRNVRTDAEGVFVFDHLPAGLMQLRVHGSTPKASGLLPFPWVLAAMDVQLATTAETTVVLTTHQTPRLRGRLVTKEGSPVAGWNVIAVPAVGTALFRAFRSRGAPTAADGSFAIADLAPAEDYQLGAFIPGAPRRRDATFPFASGRARPGTTDCTLVVDPITLPRAHLRCRVLGANGVPCPGAELELLAVQFQMPMSKSAATDGRCEFGPLHAGEYWLAIAAPGLGTRTLLVTVPDGAVDVDLQTIELQSAARVRVQVRGLGVVPQPGVHVLLQNTLGDKSVTAYVDALGVAELPALPPGESRLTVYGRGIAPSQRLLQLTSGPQSIDQQVEAAPTVPILVTFVLADNPFTVNGPLHIRIWRDDGSLLLEHNAGAVTSPGAFDVSAGLLPGRYRIQARSLWNAQAQATFEVAASGVPASVNLRLAR